MKWSWKGEMKGVMKLSKRVSRNHVLFFVESSKEGETVVETGDRDSPGSQSVRRVAGFGEMDDGSEEESESERDSASDDSLDSGGDGESVSTLSADSDARHDIDFLRDQLGESVAILLMAS